jgi:transposase
MAGTLCLEQVAFHAPLTLNLSRPLRPGDPPDRAIKVITKLCETWNGIIKIFADDGYRGALIDKVDKMFKIGFEVIKRSELHIFKVLPNRWIVGRTFAWTDTNKFPDISKNGVDVTMSPKV